MDDQEVKRTLSIKLNQRAQHSYTVHCYPPGLSCRAERSISRLERVGKLHSIGNESIRQAEEGIPTGQGVFPIHHQPAEAIMPRVGPLDLPAPHLASRMDTPILSPAPFGCEVSSIPLHQDNCAGRGIGKGRIQTQAT